MKHVYLMIVTVFLLHSCKKNRTEPLPPGNVSLLLKDISYSSLPSPYYYFEYDAAGRVINTRFASGIVLYQVNYTGNAISEIQKTNATNKDRLVYTYDNGRPSLIKYIHVNGEIYKRCFITYTPAGKPAKMEWEIKFGTVGFILIREMSFTYYADGNLKDLTARMPAIDGNEPESTYTDHYENYDAGKNTDEFTLYQNFNDHILLLPGIKLQQNNPRRVTRTGVPFTYEINFNYTYNNQQYPVSRNGLMKITGGTDAGKELLITAGYSYY
jgi:hypothetical protein